MTPFATIDVSRSGVKIISGVQLEPDGLQFTDAVRLSVTAPLDNPGVGLIFSFAQDGSNVAFAPTANTSGGKTAIAEIWHFSSAGYTNGDTSGQDGLDALLKRPRRNTGGPWQPPSCSFRTVLPLLPSLLLSASFAAAPR